MRACRRPRTEVNTLRTLLKRYLRLELSTLLKNNIRFHVIGRTEELSPDVRHDFATWFDRAVPDGAPYWTHTMEGADDMPAHVKSSLLGFSLTLPIRDGRLALGTWQGIYLCEHRDHGGARSLIATLQGE